ncbi:SRPBCC family protein [Actinomadura meridiana]|uniref:SRPBCC family protein n=2 Tax=Actinomadura meridiana TaxID=559626 RepID=A0ABP8CDG6_9ACTN
MVTQDKIEREIVIDAPVNRVWSLVTEPGWWVGDGDRTGQRRRREGDLELVDDPKFGTFPVRVESVEPQRYASYRWASGFPGQTPAEDNSTLVEFWLSERDDGGTLLRVVESGFDSLAVTEEVRERSVEGNTEGWTGQLNILKTLAERVNT